MLIYLIIKMLRAQIVKNRRDNVVRFYRSSIGLSLLVTTTSLCSGHETSVASIFQVFTIKAVTTWVHFYVASSFNLLLDPTFNGSNGGQKCVLAKFGQVYRRRVRVNYGCKLKLRSYRQPGNGVNSRLVARTFYRVNSLLTSVVCYEFVRISGRHQPSFLMLVNWHANRSLTPPSCRKLTVWPGKIDYNNNQLCNVSSNHFQPNRVFLS